MRETAEQRGEVKLEENNRLGKVCAIVGDQIDTWRTTLGPCYVVGFDLLPKHLSPHGSVWTELSVCCSELPFDLHSTPE